MDLFDAKADALALLASLGVPLAAVGVVPGGPDYLHPGRSARLQLGPKAPIGCFGELHPAALAALGVEGPLVAFEIELDALPPPKAKPTKARPKLDLVDLMPVERDFAFVVGRDVPAADIVRAITAADRTLVTGATVFDVYRGAGIPEGQVSVAVAVTLQPRERTMTDVEIDAVAARIAAEVQRKTGGVLRG